MGQVREIIAYRYTEHRDIAQPQTAREATIAVSFYPLSWEKKV